MWSSLRNSRKGRGLFLIGCGASLRDMNLDALHGAEVLAMNAAVLYTIGRPFAWHGWINIDWIPTFRHLVNPVIDRGGVIFLNSMTRPVPPPHERIIRLNPCDIGGEQNVGHCDWNTMDFALSVAVAMGYSRVHLVACDAGIYRSQGHAVYWDQAFEHGCYGWTRHTVERHAKLIDIRSAGPAAGSLQRPHATLADATAMERKCAG